MFVIQRVLEIEGRLTLLDQSRVIEPHPSFRLFATSNTVGLGDATGLYHGTQPLNQGQIDRWNLVITLNYLAHDREVDVVLARCPEYRNAEGRARASAMVALANLTRRGFADGDLSTVMSPRTVVTWAQNTTLFHDAGLAFKLTFLNRCDEDERALVAEYYQRCMGEDLVDERPAPGLPRRSRRRRRAVASKMAAPERHGSARSAPARARSPDRTAAATRARAGQCGNVERAARERAIVSPSARVTTIRGSIIVTPPQDSPASVIFEGLERAQARCDRCPAG